MTSQLEEPYWLCSGVDGCATRRGYTCESGGVYTEVRKCDACGKTALCFDVDDLDPAWTGMKKDPKPRRKS